MRLYFGDAPMDYLQWVVRPESEFWLPELKRPRLIRVHSFPVFTVTLNRNYTGPELYWRDILCRSYLDFVLSAEVWGLSWQELRRINQECSLLPKIIGGGRNGFGHLLARDFTYSGWLDFLKWLGRIGSAPDYLRSAKDSEPRISAPAAAVLYEAYRVGVLVRTKPPPLRLPCGAAWDFRRPLLLGILNVTPDSFSDGGRFLGADAAVAHALKMVADGADALDLGAESSRPGSRGVPARLQKARLLPVLKRLRKERALRRVPLSIDTQSAEVFRACLGEGADLLNDISALRKDRAMPRLVARAGCPVILMHMLGTPRSMQKDPRYTDVVDELDLFFRRRIHAAHDAGIKPTNILLDPGIGFGKTLEHNCEILRRLEEFKALGRPLVVGVSRKRFLGLLTGEETPSRRVLASVAAGILAVRNGAAILRIHDVAEHVQALKVAAALQ
jgi:dihydropteroate synthase